MNSSTPLQGPALPHHALPRAGAQVELQASAQPSALPYASHGPVSPPLHGPYVPGNLGQHPYHPPPGAPPQGGPPQGGPPPGATFTSYTSAPGLPFSAATVVAVIGSFLFLIGASYFLYWSIEQGWFPPVLRVAIGMATGLALCLGAAWVMRGKPAAVGVPLYAAGIGTIYFSSYYGSIIAKLFSPSIAFAVAVAATMASGALAIHHDSQASFCGSYALGLITPLIFSHGTGRVDLLVLFLLLLMLSTLVVLYRLKRVTRWLWLRAGATMGTWTFVVAATPFAPATQLHKLAALAVATLAVSMVWIWLPGRKFNSRNWPYLWLAATGASLTAFATLFARLNIPLRSFSYLLAGYVACELALIAATRRRFGDSGELRAFYFTALAQCIVGLWLFMQSRYVTVAWGALALGLVLAAHLRKKRSGQHFRAFYHSSALATLIASLGWGYTLLRTSTAELLVADLSVLPFANYSALTACLVMAAWWGLASKQGEAKVFGFAALQIVAHITLAFELSRAAHAAGAMRLAPLSSTILFALSAGGQFIKSILDTERKRAKAWAWASYLLFPIASVKLLVIDLHAVSNIVRAASAVGIGVIFMAAALIANKLQPGQEG